MAVSIKTRGLIVSEALMGEQDKRLTILCADRGKLSVIAKGAKKQGGRLAAQVQLFYYCDFMLEQSRNFWIIKEASVLESFYDLRRDMDALAWASWMVETGRILAVEGEGCGDMLRLLLRGLQMVTEPRLSSQMTAVAFVLRALSQQGLRPESEHCLNCGRKVEREGALSASMGGVVCADCARRCGDRIAIREGGLYTLRHILDAPLEKLYKFNADEGIQEALFGFAVGFLHNYVQKELTSLEFLQELRRIEEDNRNLRENDRKN